jgi:WS/DGAT/MGAT family acyltransferase
LQRAKLPLRLARDAWKALRDGEGVRETLRERLGALGELARFKLEPASDTPLNGAIGPHRIVDWASFPLAEAREVAHAHGASLNDFVLSVVTGALRGFFEERGIDPDRLHVRASCPVNVRAPKDRERAGNFVSSWLVELPLAERDPLDRLRKLHEATRELKRRHVASGVQSLVALHEWLPLDLQALSRGAQNLIVTNVPGPDHPLYLRGARLEAMYALAPLMANVGLSIAATSYDGKLCIALNADEDRVPDLHEVVRLLRAAYAELADSAAPKRAVQPVPAPAAPQPLRALGAVATTSA